MKSINNSRGKKYILDYEKLQTGDIILQSGKSITSYAIRCFTLSRFSHAMIMLTDRAIIHANNDVNVYINDLRFLLVDKKTDLEVLRIDTNLSKKEKQDIEEFLRSKVGTKYSTNEAFKVSPIFYKTRNIENKKQFCSRLVSQAYNHIGYKIVKNTDFNSPKNIKNTILEELNDISNMVREATEKEINFARNSSNIVDEQGKSLKEFIDEVGKLFKKDFNNEYDIIEFIINNNSADKPISEFLKENKYFNGYLSYINTFSDFLYLDKFKIYIQKIPNLQTQLKENSYYLKKEIERINQNLITTQKNIKTHGLEFFKLKEDGYKNMISVYLLQLSNYLKAINEDSVTKKEYQKFIASFKQFDIKPYNLKANGF